MASIAAVPEPLVAEPALSPLHQAVLHEALTGLGAPQKTLTPWLFYDERGSQLFEQITELPEYYLTRTERSILAANASNMLERAATFGNSTSQRLTMLELGSGSSSKTGLLLAAAVARQGSVVYQPIDVSASALDEAEQTLAANFPGVTVLPQVANYTSESFTLARNPDERALALYIGSSIGNFAPHEARAVLANLREHLIPGDALLLGVDLAPGEHKSVATLVAAYDDASGVTAAFNKNVLARLNRDLRADFDLDCFAHRAKWNARESRMEMHLESLAAQTVTLWSNAREAHQFHFAKGETIHTENSYKFTPNSIAGLLRASDPTGGFVLEHTWTDSDARFAVVLARAV